MASSSSSLLLIIRGWKLFIVERSIRRTLSLWVILWILYKKAKDASVLCLLRYLNNQLLNNVKLVSLCVFLGMNAAVQDYKEIKEEETIRDEVRQVQHVAITFQENQETVEVHEDEHEAPQETTENPGVKEENLEVKEEVHEDGHEAPSLEEIEVVHEDGHEETTEKLDVKAENTEEEKDLQLLKRRSDWWVNTRNVMAMVAIFLATVSITGSFTPPANVLDVKVAAILFSVAINICLMVSMSVLFFLFGVTSTSPSIEQRILKLANLGLWISLFSLTAAYLVNMWVSIIYKELKICLIISICVWFGLLATFLFSAKFRAVFGGVKVLKETDDDVRPYILYEIFFKVQEADVVTVEV